MGTTGLTIVKMTSIVFAGVFLILGAVFTFLEILQEGKNNKVREWFARKWIVIRASRLLGLPERTIGWTLNVRSFLQKWIKRGMDGIRSRIDEIGLTILLVVASLWIMIGIWVLYRRVEVCIYLAGGTFFVLSWMLFLYHFFSWLPKKKFNNRFLEMTTVIVFVILHLIAIIIYLFLLLIGPLVGGVVWLVLLLKINVIVAALVALAMIPMYALSFFLTPFLATAALFFDPEAISDKRKDLLTAFAIGVSGSFAVTLGSLGVGHMMSPMAWVPQTVQMLFSNVLCDGLTLVVTFWLLRWAVAKKAMFRIPTAIVVDVVIAGVLAGLSLFCGLTYTEHYLSIGEVGNILVGRAAEGGRFEFGPYFWVMHTTFIPTIMYLGLILVCWLGKAMLTVAEKFTGRALEHEKPLALTAALFGIFFAVFTAISLWIEMVEGG